MDVWIGGLAICSQDCEAVLKAMTASYKAHKFELISSEDPNAQGDERALVVEGSKGWTSVYPEEIARDSDLAAEITSALKVGAIVHRAVLYDAFSLLAFAGGDLIDEFQSHPSYIMDFDSQESEASVATRTQGNAHLFAALSPRIHEQRLAEIFAKCRVTDPDSYENPDMSVARALKELRGVLGLGTLEHSFDDLWYGAENFRLNAKFLAFKDTQKIRGPLKKWQTRYRQASSLLQRGSESVSQSLQSIRKGLPELPFRRKPLDQSGANKIKADPQMTETYQPVAESTQSNQPDASKNPTSSSAENNSSR